MTRRLALAVFLTAVPFAAWSCSGCDSRSPGADKNPDMVSSDAPRGPDLLQPDSVNPACGGSRRVQPEEVSRGRGFACGKGCRQVTFGADANSYDVSGDLLVYSGGVSIDRQVYLVDLKRDREWLIHKMPVKKPGCFPVSTDGIKIAYSCAIWPDKWNIAFPIQNYNPITREEVEQGCWMLEAEKSQVPLDFGLGEQGIIMDMSMTSPQAVDAFFYRFSDNTLTNISQRKGGVWFTHISGTRAVWTQAMWLPGESGYTQIILYDSQANTKRQLAPFKGNQYMSRIKGDQVVWMDNRNSPGSHLNPGNSDIYLHDLKTGETRVVSAHQARQDIPDVEGDLVVWEDWRNNPSTMTPKSSAEYKNSDVYMMDLGSGKETQLTAFAAKGYKDLETQPRIDHRRVFFTMSTPKVLAVFMIDLDRAVGR